LPEFQGIGENSRGRAHRRRRYPIDGRLWTFGRLDKQWKLKEVLPPASGKIRIGLENIDQDSQLGPATVVLPTAPSHVRFLPNSLYQFLMRDLGESARPFKVFFGHHPTYSSGLHGSVKKMQEYLQPLFEEKGVQLVVSGHDHSYERTIVKGVTYVVSGGGGAPLYAQQNTLKNPRSLVYREAYHFVRVDVTSGELVLTAWAVDKSGASTQADHAVIKH
jgi:hypothetical protein